MRAPFASLTRGLGWWLGALTSVLASGPEPFARHAVRLRPRSGGFAVIGADGTVHQILSARAPYGSAALEAVRRARARYLDLDDETVLSVVAILPAAARADLREAVALRMSELTPFTEDEVAFDLARPAAHGADAVSVRVFIAPNRMIAEYLAELSNLNIVVDGIVASETGETTGADIPDFAPQIHRRRSARLGMALVFSCALLIGGLGWLHAVAADRQAATRDALTGAVGIALENIRQAKALEDEITVLSASLASPRERRAGQIQVLDLLNGIAGALPDDSYLIGLNWSGGEVTITGLAANASSLIGLLEASPILSEVRFSAPVARDQRLDRDRFSITANPVAPAGGR